MITHGKPGVIGPALERLEALAKEHGVELLLPTDEAEKHGRTDGHPSLEAADVAVVLGGDGTMLRALTRFLGTGIPVLGVNFGRVGFLSSFKRDEMETGLARAFRGDFDTVDLPTLETRTDGARHIGRERRGRPQRRRRPHGRALLVDPAARTSARSRAMG